MKRSFILIIFTVLLSIGISAQSRPAVQPIDAPADFKGDGCTMFPDCNFGDCCLAHDKDYFRGGTSKERKDSDKRLHKCVRSKKGWQNKILAPVMWLGVRVFGTPHLPTSFRWGFGQKKLKVKSEE